MCVPSPNVPVYFVILFDAEFGGVFDRAGLAVVQAVFAVDGWVGWGEEG